MQIPIKENSFPFADTRNIAIRRFHQIETRLQKDTELKEKYNDFMREYERLGHMTPVTRPAVEGRTCYIPHHCIRKDNKIRVVFDGSVENVDGISLNK